MSIVIRKSCFHPEVVIRSFVPLLLFFLPCLFPAKATADAVFINFPALFSENSGFSSSNADGSASGSSFSGNLIRIGAFSGNPTTLIGGLTAITTPSAILANLESKFTQYTSFTFSNTLLSPDTPFYPTTDPDTGVPLVAQPSIGASLRGQDIYLLFYNAATTGEADQLAIFRMKDSSMNGPTGSDLAGIFSTAAGADAQYTSSFNLSTSESDMLIGQYLSSSDTFVLGKLSGGVGQITSATTLTMNAGSTSTHQILSNNGADTFALTSAPSWASISAATGLITLSPGSRQRGPFNLTFTASNSLTGNTSTGSLAVTIQAAAAPLPQNRSSYAFDGNLNNSLGESSLSGESLVYATDRRGNLGKAVRPGGANGLTRSSSAPDITSDATVAFWFKMPETDVPTTGWWLFSSGSLGVRLLPDPAGTKVQVEGLEGWQADQFTQTLNTWSAGSGWHHLCIRLCDSNSPEGARVFYDGAELGYAYYEYRGTLDLNNFCLGSKTGTADGSFFPGEFDDFVLYDEPLGIYEPSEWIFPGHEHFQYEDLYANPTISELYLGLASLRQNHALFGLGIDSTPWPDQYNIYSNESPYDVAEIESLFGIVALQDNGDLCLLDTYTGNTFRADPNDTWNPGQFGQYSRKACDPRMLYGNAQAVAGPLHLIVLKKNGNVVEQKWGTGNGYSNLLGNVTTRHTGCIAVSAGFNIGMALGADGSVRVWHPFPEGTQGLPAVLFAPGRPLEYGQTTIPVTARNCVAIAAGEEHCLALTADGRVVAWGNNDVGQTSVPAPALTDVVKIAAGPFSSIALKKDGTIITWGDNKADSQNPPAEWQGHFRDILTGRGMMGGVTDLGRPILWSHGPETGYENGTADEVAINDESLRTLSMSLPAQVSKLTTGYMSPFLGLGGLVTYETKTAVPLWKVQIPQKVAVPEQSSLRLDLRTFLTTSAIPNLRFEAIGLPEGSSLDSATGTLVISTPPTSYRAVQILARNDQGLDRWTFILQSGAQGVGIQPLPAIESTVPIKLAELMVPSGWSSPTPMDPSRYEVKVVGDRMEIWSTGGLDYENPADRSLMITISGLDLAGVVQTASSPIILGNNSSEDVDHDGLLEIYEQFYGTSDLLADSDGDLFADLYEIQHGTSPSQASANPRVAPISLQKSLTGSSFAIDFLAPFGKKVYLESSMDLKVWSYLPSEGEILSSPVPGVEGDGKMHQLTIPITEPRMFFRTSCEDLGSTPPQ